MTSFYDYEFVAVKQLLQLIIGITDDRGGVLPMEVRSGLAFSGLFRDATPHFDFAVLYFKFRQNVERPQVHSSRARRNSRKKCEGRVIWLLSQQEARRASNYWMRRCGRDRLGGRRNRQAAFIPAISRLVRRWRLRSLHLG